MARNRGERDDLDKSPGSITKDSSVGLLRILIVLIFFVVGVVIGLTSSSHINQYFTVQTDQFYENYALPPMTAIASRRNCTCEKEDCLSMDSYLRPNNLTHSMSDKELFWRASMMPKKEDYPYSRVPKVAFMFLTRGPLPLVPLWERFFEGHEEQFSIYVHALPGYELNVSTSSPFYRRQIPSKMAEMEIDSTIMFSLHFTALLSESCIPVYNFPTVYKYLIESTQSFVESYDDPSRYGRGRYSRRMRPDIRLVDWRKGSQWFEVNRTLAIMIVSDTKYYTIFRKYCRPSCYPDEHYIPTFLNMFYGSFNANRTVTWVDWSLGGPHPATYGEEVCSECVGAVTRSHVYRIEILRLEIP
ncbi:hypothetical protein TEA_019925 [Camellia sinensis var. sinensis]|uniref:Uncharacterized protein n=1 Tax=Camellia sinensis var. sinensis TaxID=542762 RepID=A0A4S4D006_CAMSN|nr:hypothetical protein TEA_019925 [Camellia sinensis var. sinensis]